MSVRKSERSTPSVKFVQDVYCARRKTLEVLKKFPKGYKFNLPARIAELADKAYWAMYEGNSVYMHKNMPYEDYSYRHQRFMEAYTALRALTAETTFCYSLLMEGNNFFEDTKIRDKTFSEWTRLCATAAKSMKSIMAADKKRYAGYAHDKNVGDELKRIGEAIDNVLSDSKNVAMDAVMKALF